MILKAGQQVSTLDNNQLLLEGKFNEFEVKQTNELIKLEEVFVKNKAEVKEDFKTLRVEIAENRLKNMLVQDSIKALQQKVSDEIKALSQATEN